MRWPFSIAAVTLFAAAGALSAQEPEYIADDFPLPSVEHMLPGYRLKNPPAVKDKEPKKEKPFDVTTRVDENRDTGPSWWDRLQKLFSSDKTWVNILILAGLVAVFAVYRIRGGRSRR